MRSTSVARWRFVDRQPGRISFARTDFLKSICLIASISSGLFFSTASANRLRTGAINEHVICIRIHRVEETQPSIKFPCQKRGVFRGAESTLREICRNQDSADGEYFAICFRSLFPFSRDEHSARCAANDSFRRAPEQKML